VISDFANLLHGLADGAVVLIVVCGAFLCCGYMIGWACQAVGRRNDQGQNHNNLAATSLFGLLVANVFIRRFPFWLPSGMDGGASFELRAYLDAVKPMTDIAVLLALTLPLAWWVVAAAKRDKGTN